MYRPPGIYLCPRNPLSPSAYDNVEHHLDLVTYPLDQFDSYFDPEDYPGYR